MGKKKLKKIIRDSFLNIDFVGHMNRNLIFEIKILKFRPYFSSKNKNFN